MEMPRIYSSTTVAADRATVHVKQVLGSSRPGAADYVKQVILTSQVLIKKVLTTKKDWSTDEAFIRFFNPNSQDLDVSRRSVDADFDGIDSARIVFGNLWKIYAGVMQEHSVKVADLGRAEGYVSNYQGRGTQGDIHLNIKRIMSNDWGNLVITYMHEASHRFAQTKDHGAQGYIDGEGFYKAPGLTPAQAAVNADSYAWFLWSSGSYEEKYAIPAAPPL